MRAAGTLEQITYPDGRVALRDAQEVQGSPLWNHDLAPVPAQVGGS
jgi:hypothetical protein